ncbi:hypothetical protein [Alkalihalobacillus deserti]|uniref:hypothetical protein n=1 Tax=Alkalihalobacillus deserti TaxID=2879466 RepID=UPI001D157950|nr:hypothetical protein [Alkalihalobacillus deserti]
MSKRTAPLLYIYQPKEVEVEASNQEFVYRKFKVHVKPSLEKAEYTLDSNLEEAFTKQMSVLEKLEYVITSSNKDQEIKIAVGEEIHKGYLEEVNSPIVVLRVLTEEKPLQLNLKEIKSVQIG